MDLEALNDIKNLTNKYNAQLLPVIKDRKFKDIKNLYDLGFREFGENRIEQLIDNKAQLQDSKFHFISPLQSRKIIEILNHSISIHTVSRKKEAIIIDENYISQDIFVQINIDNDPNKNGIKVHEVDLFFNFFEELSYFPVGIMCIPNIELDSKIAFSNMQKVNEKIKARYKNYDGKLSMGMSDDYEIALDYGATIIRIGSKIFR